MSYIGRGSSRSEYCTAVGSVGTPTYTMKESTGCTRPLPAALMKFVGAYRTAPSVMLSGSTLNQPAAVAAAASMRVDMEVRYAKLTVRLAPAAMRTSRYSIWSQRSA
jgi:hypothetical protein